MPRAAHCLHIPGARHTGPPPTALCQGRSGHKGSHADSCGAVRSASQSDPILSTVTAAHWAARHPGQTNREAPAFPISGKETRAQRSAAQGLEGTW